MKLPWKLFVVVLFLVPIFAHAESIASFQSELLLRADSTLSVTEWITYDFEGGERHGIFRTIPLSHPSPDPDAFHTRYITITVEGVAMDELEVPYTATEQDGVIEIKIGDPDRTITGVHTYEINYLVAGALQYLPDGSVDLYWNVTGNEWQVPIREAAARLPDTDGLYLERAACYEGSAGSTASCAVSTTTAAVAEFYAADLLPGEGLTIARAVDPEKVARVELLKRNLLWLLLILVPLWFIGLIFLVYREVTRHRTGRAIIPEYEPYERIAPMYTGLLFDGRLDPHDITAGIVHLAQKGFLAIKKVDRKVLFLFETDDYEITLKKPLSEAAGEFELEILKLLFSEAEVGAKITLGDLANDTRKKAENSLRIQGLHRAATHDLESKGYFEKNLKKIGILGAGALMLAAVLFVFVHVAAVFFVVATFAVLAFGFKRRTRKGYEALDHLKGFKLFLSVTEKERYEFHNAPEKSPEMFMEYLPYAIAFGVEKKWADVFKDITIPDPDWYDGGGVGHFSAVNLTTSLGAFSTAFASSSGTSASSGGGSSGGGGGGGGGGSW